MTEKEILRYLSLVDRKLVLHLSSGINWKPEYETELADIERELEKLRILVEEEHLKFSVRRKEDE